MSSLQANPTSLVFCSLLSDLALKTLTVKSLVITVKQQSQFLECGEAMVDGACNAFTIDGNWQ